MSEIPRRVRALRALMRRRNLAAWIVPSGDPHGSEYVPDRYQGRRWISGFGGSAGTAVVAARSAAVWTDSRYWIDAGRTLAGSPFELVKQGSPDAPTIARWLARTLRRGEAVGIAADTVPLARFRALERELGAAGLRLRAEPDLLDALWTDRPALPSAPFWLLDDRWTGESRASKLKRLRAAAPRVLVADLAEVAWLLNLRGNDVPTSPIGAAYLLVGPRDATLFADAAKVPDDVRLALSRDGVRVKPYDDVAAALRASREPVQIDPDVVGAGLAKACRKATEAPSPAAMMKAVKNRVERRGFRDALVRDGAALAKFLCWLDGALGRRERVTELSASEKLHAFRAAQDRFLCDSFEAIVAYEANAALPHYRPGAREFVLKPRGILLVDSGGTYRDGTTDTTRVHALGPVSGAARRSFTLVLKGVISLSRATFPKGTSGLQLDAFARRALWDAGLDFGHGTGHGVGHVLNVHEGPNGFRTRGPQVPMEPGMITTIEPGHYVAGRYGIRIENIVAGVKRPGGFVGFDTLTLAPICPDLVDARLMTADETAWLDAYHRRVYAALAPRLDPAERRWLARQTRPVGRTHAAS
jgi:Xaa-Pro aminopeptidase